MLKYAAVQNNIVIFAYLCYKGAGIITNVQLQHEINVCFPMSINFIKDLFMKNTNMTKTKSPPGLKTIPAKNISRNKQMSGFIRMIYSLRSIKIQQQVASRQALAKRQLNGFSKHMLEDIGFIGDVFQKGDVTNSCRSFIGQSPLENGDTPSSLPLYCASISIQYIDFSHEEVALKKVA